MAISNDLLSSTLFAIRDAEVDQLYRKTAFLDLVKSAGGIEYEDGGIKLQRPLSVVDHSTITQLATGYEPVSLAVSDVLKPAIYEWQDFVAPVVITKKEELENQGEKAIVKIVEARMKNVMGMFRRELNKQILAGSSSVMSNMSSLNGFTLTTGFFEEGAATPAGQTNTVGGLSKATLNVPGWFNSVKALTGTVAGLNADMTALYQECNQFSPFGDVSAIIVNPNVFSSYKASLFDKERYMSSDKLDGGRLQLAFAGAVVEQDNEMPANGGGANTYGGYFLNFEGIKMVFHSDGDFAVSPFEFISGTTARSAQVYLKAQLIADHLRGSGVLTGTVV
jgi:hypothetical protein